MSIPVLKTLFVATCVALSGTTLAAATLVQDVRVFDGKAVHERATRVGYDGWV